MYYYEKKFLLENYGFKFLDKKIIPPKQTTLKSHLYLRIANQILSLKITTSAHHKDMLTDSNTISKSYFTLIQQYELKLYHAIFYHVNCKSLLL